MEIACTFSIMEKRPKTNRKQYRRTRIREWRKKRGMTIEQLSGLVGIEASALSYLERGQSGYTQGTLEKISEALKVSVGTLISKLPPADPDDPGEDPDYQWQQADDAEKQRILRTWRAFKSVN